VGSALGELFHADHVDAGIFQPLAGALGGDDLVAECDEAAGDIDGGVFVPLADADEDFALGGKHSTRGKLSLGKSDAEPLADAHHFARAPHFRTENYIDAGELAKR